MSNVEQIIIRQVVKPNIENQEQMVEWFCQVFGLTNKGNELQPMMFRQIVQTSINGEGITSLDLTEELEIPRSTVIYHLNQFIVSGLVIRRGRRYLLRSEDLASTIEELQADMVREFNRMIDMAKKMDQLFEDEANGGRK